jgi:hypothetical protein
MTQKSYTYLSKLALIAAVSLTTSVLFAPHAWAQG